MWIQAGARFGFNCLGDAAGTEANEWDVLGEEVKRHKMIELD